MLLGVGRRCDKKTNIHAPDEQHGSRNGEQRNHLACKWVEIRRSCVFVPIDSLFTHEFFAPSALRVGMRRGYNSYSTESVRVLPACCSPCPWILHAGSVRTH